MPPLSSENASAPEWLRFAQSDLAYAAAPVPSGGLYNVPCFHAQQAVEKSIKAVLVLRGIEFERSHAIAYLAELLPDDVRPVPRHADAVELTRYSVAARYPGDFDDLTEEDQRHAAQIALAVVNWASHIFESR
jgi:HEPN domain-containing protein